MNRRPEELGNRLGELAREVEFLAGDDTNNPRGDLVWLAYQHDAEADPEGAQELIDALESELG